MQFCDTDCKSALRRRICLVILSLVLWAGFSRASEPALQRFQFTHPAMGTLFSITCYAENTNQAYAATTLAFKRIDVLEDIMSDYQADSELMLLCEKPPGQPVPVSADLFVVLQRAQKVSEISGGAFDVTVGPYVRLWRFARKKKVLPMETELRAAAPAVGFRKLRLDKQARTVTLLVPNMRLDLGGIAKGFAADEALEVLKGRGVNRALVAASGDIAIGEPPPGKKGWTVGISSIDAHDNETTTNVMLANAGISTSGDTEQFIEIGGRRYSHIIDPTTGLGLTNRIQATVIARDATTTDAMATTVCVLGPKRGIAAIEKTPHAAALILTKDDVRHETLISPRFRQFLPKTTETPIQPEP
jgi:thiamine biosynthesis lipoprotein